MFRRLDDFTKAWTEEAKSMKPTTDGLKTYFGD